MTIRFSCPSCAAIINAPPVAAGKEVRCPRCRQLLLVPVPAGELLPPAPEIPYAFLVGDGGPQPARRFPLAPSFLAVALGTFFLPWLDVRCNNGVSLASQSGLQVILGSYSSPIPDDHPKRLEITQSLEKKEWRIRNEKREYPELQALRFLPVFLFPYPVFLALGIAWGYLCPRSTARMGIVFFFACVALICLLAQVVIGFPVENLMQLSKPDDLKGLDVAKTLMYEIRYTPWFWISLAGTIAGAVWVLAESRESPDA